MSSHKQSPSRQPVRQKFADEKLHFALMQSRQEVLIRYLFQLRNNFVAVDSVCGIWVDFTNFDALALAIVFLTAEPRRIFSLPVGTVELNERFFTTLRHLAPLPTEDIDFVAGDVHKRGHPIVLAGKSKKLGQQWFSLGRICK